MRLTAPPAILAVLTVTLAAAPGASALPPTSFSCTGSEESYTVPAGVSKVDVRAIGAPGGGGHGGSAGGRGAQVDATLDVTPGQMLYVQVGCPGATATGGGGASGGWSTGAGGGPGHAGGGGGGGASFVYGHSLDLTSALVVAAGGGGGGAVGAPGTIGNGGDAGSSGVSGVGGVFPGGGGGAGSASSGGWGGGSTMHNGGGHAGQRSYGGPGGGNSAFGGRGGGGGGGGYYGGGGGGAGVNGAPPGNAGGGGGGSSLLAGGTLSLTTAAPSVTLTPLASTADASSSSLLFGSTRVGETAAAQEVAIVNNGDDELVVGGVSVSGVDAADFAVAGETCTGGPVGPGDGCTVSVTFSPGAAGVRSAVLDVVSNALAGDTHVSLQGTGTASTADASSSSLLFGSTRVGETAAAQEVAIVNNGDDELVVGSVSVSGVDAADFAVAGETCSGGPVGPGDGCTVSVTFSPGAAGVRSAVLDVVSNALAGDTHVSLQGTGTVPTSGEGGGSSTTPEAPPVDTLTPAGPPVALRRDKLSLRANRRVRLVLACSRESSGTVELRVRGEGRSPLGRKRFRCAAGERTAVVYRVSRSRLGRLLHRSRPQSATRRTLKAAVHFRLREPGGERRDQTLRVALRLPGVVALDAGRRLRVPLRWRRTNSNAIVRVRTVGRVGPHRRPVVLGAVRVGRGRTAGVHEISLRVSREAVRALRAQPRRYIPLRVAIAADGRTRTHELLLRRP